MKVTTMKSPQFLLRAALALTVCAAGPAAWAAPITKANNNTDLDLPGSWVGGVVPTVGDTAVWDSTVSSATSAAIGASAFLQMDALQFLNPANDFTVTGGAGNFLYLWSAGTAIDLSAATRDLTLNCDVAPQGNGQVWDISAGRMLTIGGDILFPVNSFQVKKRGEGTLRFVNTRTTTLGDLFLERGTTLLSGGDDRLPVNVVLRVGAVNGPLATLDLGGGTHTIGRMLYPFTDTTNVVRGVMTNGNLVIAGENGSGNTVFYAGNGSQMDFSGVNSLSANLASSTLRTFSVQPFMASGANATNTVLLPRTNVMRLGLFRVGGSGTSQGTHNLALVRLGANNVINSDTIEIGGFNARGTVDVQDGIVAPALTIRDSSGTGRTPLLRVGETSSGARPGDGVLDLSGGTLDVLATEVRLGRMIANASVNDTSTLNMGGGTFDATSMVLSFKSAGGTPTIASTFNQLGGLVIVDTMIMGTNNDTVGGGAPGTPTLRPTYNISGGTLRAASIFAGPGQASASSVRVINWTNGTIQNYNASTDLTLTGVTVSAPGAGTRSFTADTSRSIVVDAALTQGAQTATPIAKDGAGTLVLEGTTDNAYAGLTVNAGTVLLNKSSSTTVHALGNDSVINAGLMQITGTGGDQIADVRTLTLNGGTFDLNGNTETIAALSGSGGTVTDSLSGGSLTLSPALNSNYVSAAALSGTFDLTKSGSGKQTLAGTDSRSGGANVINDGILEIGNGGATGSLNGDVTINGGTLAFNRSGTLNYAGNISGAGNVAQNGPGTLILSGFDAHTGGTLVNSGTLTLPAAATSIGGSTITVAPGAVFDVTPAGGSFALVGQLLNGAGSVVGPVFVGSGSKVAGTLTTGALTLGDSATNAPGGDLAAGTLNASSVTFNFGSVFSVDLAPATTVGGGVNDLLAISGNLNLSSPCSLRVQQLGATLASGTYVLATFSSFTGSPANMSVPTSLRYTYTLTTNATQLLLTVSGAPGNLVWRGDGLFNAWDDGVTANWFNTGNSLIEPFFSGDVATFDNTGSNNVPVSLNTQVFPSAVTVNASQDYIITGPGSLSGAMALTKSGAGTLTMDTANDFGGAVNLNGGVLSVPSVALTGNASPLGAGTAVNFNGGSLEYTGDAVPPAGFNRLVNLGAGGGTVALNSAGNFLFLTNTIAGAGTLTKTGSKQLILGQTSGGVPISGDNTYDGNTLITDGQIQIRHPNALGSTVGKTVVTNAGSLAVGGGWVATIAENLDLSGDGGGSGALQVNDGGTEATFTGTVTLYGNAAVGGGQGSFFPSAIGGPGALHKLGGSTLTLLNNANTYAGGTVINAGTVRLGTNDTSGWLPPQPSGVALTNNGTINFNRADTNTLSANITGLGGLVHNGSGLTILGGNSDFGGGVGINNGQLRVTSNHALGAATSGTTVAGGQALTARLELAGGVTLAEPITLGQKAGTNNLVGPQPAHLLNVTNNNTITGDIRITGGGNYWGISSDSGLLTLTTLTNDAGGFTRPIYLMGSGNGEIVGALEDLSGQWLQIRKHGTGTWTLDGYINLPQGLGAFEGRLVIETNANYQAALGNAVSVREVGTLIINDLDFPVGVNVSGGGVLGGHGNIFGSVTASNGGTVGPGLSIGTLTCSGGLYLGSGGVLLMELDRSHPAKNDVLAGFVIPEPGSALTVANIGPALQVGDTFQLFPTFTVFGDFGATNLPPNYAWAVDLGGAGTIQVTAVLTPPIPTTPTNITFVVTPTNITMGWPSEYIGWSLQAQTNLLSAGLKPAATNWTTIPGTELTNTVTLPITKTNPTTFYRLFYTLP